VSGMFVVQVATAPRSLRRRPPSGTEKLAFFPLWFRCDADGDETVRENRRV